MSERPKAPEMAHAPDSLTAEASSDSLARERLLTLLQGNTAPLLGVIRSYVTRFGLAQGPEADATTLDAFQEMVVEALAHADRFTSVNPMRSPMAWLLGIAVNIIRRRQANQARQRRHEQSISQLAYATDEAEALDRALALHIGSAPDDPEQEIETAEQARDLLALVAPEDRQVLQLAIVDGLDGRELAERLGVTPGTARMRLHRALTRLRAAWAGREAAQSQAQTRKGGAPHDA